MSHSRKRTSIKAEFRAGRRRGIGKIRNIGEGGLFVGTSDVPEAGEQVAIRFRAPGGETLVLSGLVWWTTQRNVHGTPGFGLRLLEDNATFHRMWERL